MKLYATTTSERASKGQGGNKEIIIRLDVEHDNKEREMFCQLGFEKQKEYFILYLYTNKDCLEIASLKIKGERQKGEGFAPNGTKCPNCYAIDNTGRTDCPKHKH